MRELREIYLQMRDSFAARAGFTPNENCDAAARLYALALEVQALEAQADWVLDQSFPQTAEGRFLDYHAAMRSLTRGRSLPAVGTLRFSAQGAAPADYVIPKGTVCLTAAGVRFETTQEAILARGELWADAAAKACEAGSSGNAVAGTVTRGSCLPAGIVNCTNPTAFSNGCDEESDESLRGRILESYHRLPNGANAAYYEREAMHIPGVAAAKAVGRARGVGTVDVYIAAAEGAPDAKLLEAVRTALEEKREIAVDLQVLAPASNPVSVRMEIEPEPGYSFDEVRAAAEAVLRGRFGGKLLGGGVTTAGLTAAVFALEGVRNCHLLSPAEDVAADATGLPSLGECLITRMGTQG